MDNQLAPFDKLSDMIQRLYADVFQPTELPAPSNDNEAQADADFERAIEEMRGVQYNE